jgi:RNA polymerase sigma factor (sigma-70 family)
VRGGIPRWRYTEIVASVAIEVLDREPHDRASRLYEAHAGWLLQYCRRQLRDLADAEDAVQTTFLYAFRALRRGVVPECERAWLTTIARNACHSQRRTRQRHPDTVELELDRIALAEPDHEEAGFLDDVRSALASLPENQRRALVLREWHGASSNEIATELELSEPATHALLFRARKSFASALGASRRPVAGLNIAALVEHLRTWAKPLLGGAALKAAVATTAAGVVVGGVIEQRTDGGQPAATPTSRPAATVRAEPRATVTPPPGGKATQPVAAPEPQATSADRRARASVSPAAPAGPHETIESVARPPQEAAEPAAPAPPPAADAPGSPPLAPAPPVDPPAPPPIELPPIVGEEPVPPIELPKPFDELLPPIEVPPLSPLPDPQLPLP